jgi:hypothetical protein
LAACLGSEEVIRYLPRNDIEDALQYAAECGHLGIVEFLFEELDSDDPDVFSLAIPLIRACQFGHLDVVKFLVAKGASNFTAAVSEAISYGQLEVVRYFFDNKLRVYESGAALKQACEKDYCTRHRVPSGILDIQARECVRILLTRTFFREELNAALRESVQKDSWEIVQLLLKAGATDLKYALALASEVGSFDCVKLLLDLGVHNTKEAYYKSGSGGHLEIIQLLRNRYPRQIGWAIVGASANNRISIVKMFLTPETSLKTLNNALVEAAMRGRLEIVKLLIEAGADSITNALVHAKFRVYTEVVEYLQSQC